MSPLQGDAGWVGTIPRVAPWAVLFCPFRAADRGHALGENLWVRMRALPLDPGFFPSTKRGTTELETEDTTLITAGT